MSDERVCDECGHAMVPFKWKKQYPEKWGEYKTAGGKGLCNGCYIRAYYSRTKRSKKKKRNPLIDTSIRHENWREEAACIGWDPRVFDAEMSLGQTICATCPVKDYCLESAIENREIGLWGGTTERERNKMRRTFA